MPIRARPMNAKADAGVARARPPQGLQRIADRARDAEPQTRACGIGRRDDDPVAHSGRAGRRVGLGHAAANRFELRLVLVCLRVELPVLADGKGNLSSIAPRRRQNRREQVRQVDFGVRGAHDLAVALERDVEPRARERRLAAGGRRTRPQPAGRTGAVRGVALTPRRLLPPPALLRPPRAAPRRPVSALRPRRAGSPARCRACAG